VAEDSAGSATSSTEREGSGDSSEGGVGDVRVNGEVKGGGGRVARECDGAEEGDGAASGRTRRMDREAYLLASQLEERKGEKYER